MRPKYVLLRGESEIPPSAVAGGAVLPAGLPVPTPRTLLDDRQPKPSRYSSPDDLTMLADSAVVRVNCVGVLTAGNMHGAGKPGEFRG
ncbi:MAG: hypothetical protein WD875_05660 [Pirellulales bacterium]